MRHCPWKALECGENPVGSERQRTVIEGRIAREGGRGMGALWVWLHAAEEGRKGGRPARGRQRERERERGRSVPACSNVDWESSFPVLSQPGGVERG